MNALDTLQTEAFWLNDLLIEPDANRIAGVHADPKAVQVLIRLSCSAPATVSTQTLLDDVWGDVIVGDNSLHQAIASLRKLLGDDAKSPIFIETIQRKGYRIVATVKREQLERHQSDASLKKRLRVLLTPILYSMIALGLLCLAYFLFGGGASAQSIAVLPFADMSPNGDQEYFGDGIAEELLNELAQLDGLRVAGRTSSFAFKGTGANHKAIAEELNVRTILEGSIRKSGDRVRVTAQLINAADGYHIWSQTYDRKLADIFAIQVEIARSVSGALGVRLGVGGVNAFRGAGTTNIDAYEAYLQGMGSSSLDHDFYERATQFDPNYSAAWSARAVQLLSTTWITDPEESPEIVERAYALVLRAVELDPESARSTSLLGMLLGAKREWIRSESAHLRALSLLPSRSNLRSYGGNLIRNGRSAAALKQYEKGEAVEPIGRRPMAFRFFVALAQGRYVDARELVELFKDVPRFGNGRLAIALNEGNLEEIKASISGMPPNAISTAALYVPILKVIDSPTQALQTLRAIYADRGSRWPSKYYDIAMLAAYFGDSELALETIGEELRISNVRLQTVWYPVMSEARQLPGFKTLVTDLNLVEYWRAVGWADLCRPLGEDDFECF